jgi:hypothetical protein
MNELQPPELVCDIAKTPDERRQVYRFRYAVYVEEMHKPLACADHTRKIVTDELDEHSTILFVRAGNEIVGTIRTLNAADYVPASYRDWFEMSRFADIPLNEISFCSRLMVAATHRGGRASWLLISRIYEVNREAGVWLSMLHCAPSLVGLYEALGYRRIGNRIVETDVGQHLTMALVTDDLAHLTAMRSAFLPLATRYPNDPRHAAWFAEEFPEHLSPISARVVGMDEFTTRLGHQLANEMGPLLDGISFQEIGPTLRQASIIGAQAGNTIVRNGEAGSEIFVLLSGAVEARVCAGALTRVLRTMGKGDVFGELGILRSGRRTADVVVLEDVQLLVLTPDFFDRIVKDLPAVAAKLLLNLSRVLAERLLSKEGVANAQHE